MKNGHALKPSEQPNEQPETKPGITVADVLEVFPGAKVVWPARREIAAMIESDHNRVNALTNVLTSAGLAEEIARLEQRFVAAVDFAARQSQSLASSRHLPPAGQARRKVG